MHISLSFFSSISSVLSTNNDSFPVQWVALTKSHSNILHTLLCICKRAEIRFWEVLCFNFFVDIFYLVSILWSYLIRNVLSNYLLFVFLKDLPPKLLKAADYILQGPQHASTAVLPPHKTSQNKKRQKYILFDQHEVNTKKEKWWKNRTAKDRQMLYNIQEKWTREILLVIFILFGFDRLNTEYKKPKLFMSFSNVYVMA